MSSFASTLMFHINRSANLTPCANKFHTCLTMYLDQKWREKRGLVKNPNNYGPLVNLPDYSFKDKRPTPYGSNQLRRIQEHQGHLKRIIQLSKEVDFAVDRHAQLLKMQEEEKQKILDSKFKPKGNKLITDA